MQDSLKQFNQRNLTHVYGNSRTMFVLFFWKIIDLFRASRRLSIPRPQLGKSKEDLHAYERHDQQNPAPDYHLHFPSGLINLAPDYRTEDSPVMRRQRKGLPQKPRPESLNYISVCDWITMTNKFDDVVRWKESYQC